MISEPSLDAWIDAFIKLHLEPEESRMSPDNPLSWADERTIFILETVDRETMWQFVMGVLARNPPDAVLGYLAAGPLEDMIADFGDYFIERIERTALNNAAFRELLHGVWKNCTPDAIWQRVEIARGAATDGVESRLS
ncbi:DUF6869 domain-containing protein [Lysobacter sp. CA199]|uniref:DUF6869 domain-containing protein n=1 Tax=Lysobacter sp. CA199 TaxID=3455608 RepID=UPI003F8D044C